MIQKHVVVGLGEIGKPTLSLISKVVLSVGYDIDSKLMNNKKYEKLKDTPTSLLHICIPFSSQFHSSVLKLSKQFDPKCIIIHSTIRAYTTKKLQDQLSIPVIYSAARGVHSRMLFDFKRYTKFYAIEKNAPKRQWATLVFSKLMNKAGVKTKRMSDPLTLELAKVVVDTSYYGWLINYAQISNMIAKKHGIDYDEMWSFADEIQKYLKNRPKMFPGFIGGHCVIPNLSLINEDSLWEIDKINNIHLKKVKNAKSIAKKYVKGRQSYDK